MSGTYEVTVRGHLGPALVATFEEFDLTTVRKPSETVVVGWLPDQPALHGLLRQVEALGLELIEVRRVYAPVAGAPPEGGQP
jgi:hypothetical protein